jgi:protease IV
MTTSSKWFWGIFAALGLVAGLFLVLFIGVLNTSFDRKEVVTTGSGEKIAVVDVKGVITSSDDVVRQLKKHRENKSIRAILLHVDTPGGAVVPSQEIYAEVKKTRESGKPIVVAMGSMATSGGYYVSCAASKIVANRATLTANIGVISEFLQVQELLGKVGVDVKIVKTGKLKDAGTPTRKMTDEEQKYFQSLMDDVLRQFMNDVATERKLSKAEMALVADGRAVTGEKAVELKLVDTLGTFEDAVQITARMVGIEGEPSLVKERKRSSWLENMVSDAAESARSFARDMIETPALSYRFAAP